MGKTACIISGLAPTAPRLIVTQRSPAVSLTRQQVEHIATLARLEFDVSEMPDFVAKLGSIVDFVDQLQQADTDDVEPMAHAIEVTNVFKDDRAQSSLPRDEALANAPRRSEAGYLVPAVLGD